MSSSIIQVNNLSKSYTISHETKESYTALRDVVATKTKKLFSFGSSVTIHKTKEEFWALKDINFEIAKGDRVGIIGRNGAGKSTLLKILSRITEPTTGVINIKGRVASLLEVGTGFHPELTGRENIFLNGAILGMTRKEIKFHFDKIVEFAEIEKFLDTPVKRFSSGMYVRLAFAVAAHLEPEILVIDEVLAVGDAQFQKKCLGKMEDVSKNEGRTVLFVSHNLAAIKTLCNKAIVLNKGRKETEGNIVDAISSYMKLDGSSEEEHTKYVRESVPVNTKMYLHEVIMVDDQKRDYFCIELHCKIRSNIESKIGVNLRLKDSMGFPVGVGCSHYFLPSLIPIEEGDNNITITTARLPLALGTYKLGVELVIPGAEVFDFAEDCLQFDITNDAVANRKFGIAQSWGYGATEIEFMKIDFK